jgi:hypothetical protein
MVPRPSEESQQLIDDAWRNILANKLDRDTLRDTFAWSHLYIAGVDRADYHAEKRIDDKLILMDVTYNQSHPALDTFRIHIVDEAGHTIRNETYSRDDIAITIPLLAQPGTRESLLHPTKPASETQPAESQPTALNELTDEERSLITRFRAVHAATQPATTAPAKQNP